jgi:hypothetical protein
MSHRRRNPGRRKPVPRADTKAQAQEKDHSAWRRIARSPWLIAVAAPIITAAALGSYHVASSHITASFTPPLSASVSYDTSRTYVWTMSYANPLEPQRIPASVRSCDGMRTWLLAAGAADTADSDIRLHLVGTQDTTVTVSGVHAQILGRAPASASTLVGCPSAGVVATPSVALNLRQDAPEALAVGAAPRGTVATQDLSGRLGAPYFTTHTIALTEGEPFDISLTGFISGTATVRWRVIVDYEIDGQPHSLAATGPTFTTAPLLCGQAYRQSWEWQWSSQPERLVRVKPKDVSTCTADTLPY